MQTPRRAAAAPHFDTGPLAERAAIPLACIEYDGRILWANAAFRALALTTPDHPDQLDLSSTVLTGHDGPRKWAMACSGHSVDLDLRWASAPDAAPGHIARLRPYLDPVLDRTVISLAVEDQREPRQALQRLQHYARMVAYSMDAIISLDGRGRISTWNAGAQNLYGYTADEVLERPLMILAADEPERLEALPGRVMDGEVVDEEISQRRRDGTVMHVGLQASPIFHGSQGIGGISMVARDVSDRRRIQEAMREAKEKAEQGAVAKSRFLANMSHEIRTPMNGILGMTELLSATNLDAEQREYVDAVRSSAETLLHLINDILDFSKIEAGRLDLENIPFDLRDTCDAVLDVMSQAAAAKGLELTGLVDTTLPHRVMGDPGRLRQVLLNLTNNAVKFTNEGEVGLRVAAAGPNVRFEVQDTGIGIPTDRVSRLFEAFSQVDASTTRRFGGTGLGLAICRELVELMGGRLEVDSVEGVGSRFWFELSLPGAPIDDEAGERPADTVLRGLRVLIIDDVPACREVLMEYCRSMGCEVRAAPDGATGTAAIAEAEAVGRPFAAILVDNGLPEINGVELSYEWRRRWPALSSALVLLTSYAQRGDGRRAYEAGFSAYLTKPVKLRSLQDTLRSAVDEGPTRPGCAEPRRLVPRHSISEARRAETRILIAEDNVVNQKVTQRMLERLGYRATLAADGRAAVDAFAATAFDVVLMDCQMPIMDGYEATAALRQMGAEGAAVPIVGMTAHAMVGDREKCLSAGMSHYLPKPVSAAALADLLESILQG